MPIVDVSALVAAPNFAPKDWQATPPAFSNKSAIRRTADLDRVLALPRRAPPTEDQYESLIDHMTRLLARPPGPCQCASMKRKCITRFRGVQAWALWELMQVGGAIGMIAVGAGKTFLDLLAPLVVPGCRVALLLVPSNLLKQLVFDYQLLAQHFRVPSLIVHGSAGRSYTVPGTPALHVLPYSKLSQPESTAWIEGLRPDLVIADECDKLRHADTATTSRVLRYFRDHPETRFCGWSGSVTDSSINDYAHLLALTLKGGTPLPIDDEVRGEWAEAIDAGNWPRPAGALLEGLTACGFMAGGEHVRDGFRRRLHETPGVVYSSESAITIDLVIAEREAPPIPPEIDRALERLRETWVRPDGEELIDALSMSKCARELACGFYYRWIFPRGEALALILEWLDARKEWHKELRVKLKRRDEHLDSELLCTNAARRAWGDLPPPTAGTLPEWRAHAWPRWRDVRDKVEPQTEAVRLSDYLVQDAARWALEHRGVVWYDSVEFGQWVAQASGLRMYGGGKDGGGLVKDDGSLTVDGSRSIIASLKSHGRGRNGLQFIFSDQLIAQPPSSATMWEQLLGRIHRPGQEANEVRAEYYAHTDELAAAYAQALDRAAYVEATVGNAQKIRLGMQRRK